VSPIFIGIKGKGGEHMARKTFKKVITSEELIEQINPQNKRLVDRFLRNFATKRSEASVKIYQSNFNIFFCWNLQNNENKFFTDIRKTEMMDFFDYGSSELKWSPNRYANVWSSLNSLSTFIENVLDDDYPDFRNQVKKIEKQPKANVRKKTILTDDQIQNLLNYLSEKNSQQACLLALACYSGARISELFRFTTDLIDLNNLAYEDLFIETSEEIKTKGRGKLGKGLYKYILKAPFEPYYLKWLEERETVMKELGVSHNHLFIKRNGSPATPDTARVWIKSWEKYLTNEEPSNVNHNPVDLYAHAFRHYLCTYLAKIGLEQELVVEIFGWSSSEMFNIYNDMTAKDKKWKGLEKLKRVIEV
jgi:integrase